MPETRRHTLPVFSIFLPLLFSLYLPLTLKGQTVSEEARSKLEASLELYHLDEAETWAESLRERGYQAFYEINILFYRYLGNQDLSYLQTLRSVWDSNLSAIESIDKSDPKRWVMLAEAQSKRAMLEFLDQNYLTSVRHARLARNAIKTSEEKFPENIEQNKILGLFNVAFGAVPSKYQWVTNSLGFRGDIEEGITQLEAAAAKSTMLRLEATIILHYVKRTMLDQEESSIEVLENERSRFEQNIILDYFLASALQNMKKNEAALEILMKRDQYRKEESEFIIFWDYLLGRAFYYKNQHREAQRYFARFLKSNKGQLFRSDALFRLGMALTLDGNYPVGRHFFQQIEREKKSGMDEDEYAEFMAGKFAAAEPGKILKALFQARNLFDGGYPDEATVKLQSIENQVSEMNVSEQTELFYRYGRIYQAQGRFDEAIQNYQKCIAQNSSEQNWMQAYACYYRGEIAREKGDADLAEKYFRQALQYDDYFYQAGLENRCKAAISELKITQR